MVTSQSAADRSLSGNIKRDLEPVEQEVVGNEPCVGVLPRLDIIARFLASRHHKLERLDFTKKTSRQPTVDECLEEITATVIKRIKEYRAKV
jgi:hypothetical protein